MVEGANSRDKALSCGGPFVAAYPEKAKKYAAERIQHALDQGAEVIAVACPTCLVNLKEGAKEFSGVKIDIQEVALAESNVLPQLATGPVTPPPPDQSVCTVPSASSRPWPR